MKPKALVLSGDGLNCEKETARAFQLAGAESDIITVNALLADPGSIHRYQLFAIPGGFSFGDQLCSGKVLAIKLNKYLGKDIKTFIGSGKLVIGICNGFQTLLQMGVFQEGERSIALAKNSHQTFIDKWVRLESKTEGFWLKKGQVMELPVRHKEGRLIATEHCQLNEALTYEEDLNGSYRNIAGLINRKGNVLGLMPHPEAFVENKQFYSHNYPSEPYGLEIFKNGVKAVQAL